MKNREREREQILVNMASNYNAEALASEIDNIFVTPNLDTLARGMTRSSISKKKPSRKKNLKK